jgi:predicted amidophosphoribosyltransferase
MPICPNCDNQAADNAIFCDQCGTKLPAAEAEPEPVTIIDAPPGGVPEGVVICPDCGAENVPGEVFCDVCGNPLEAPEPVSVSESTAVEEIVAAEPTVGPAVKEVVEVEPEVDEVIDAELEVEEAVVPIVEQVTEEDLYCPTCGAKVGPEDVYCGNCGAALSQAVSEEAAFEVAPIMGEPEAEVEPAEEIVEEVIEGEPVEEIVMELEVLEEELVAEPKCPVCGANIIAGQAFCASCGAALQPVEEVEAVAETEPAAPTLGPFLEVVDSGAQIPLVDQDEILVGREDEVSDIHPDVDMTPHRGEEGGVSRRHAQLIREAGSWYVTDLDSTNGTYLNGVELQPKVRVALEDGDRLVLGEVEVVFHSG